MTDTSDRFPGHIAQPELAEKLGASSSAVARVAEDLGLRKVYMPPAFGKNTGPVRVYSPTEAKRISAVIEERQKKAPNRWPNRPRPADPVVHIEAPAVPVRSSAWSSTIIPWSYASVPEPTEREELRAIRLLLERMAKVWGA